MAYFPPTGSVVAFQATPANLQVTASVAGTVNIGTTPGSVVAFQGTSPWTVDGTVGASIIGTVPTTQSGTYITSITGIPSISGTVIANQGTGFGSIAAHIKSGSVIAVLGGNTSIVQGTTPWIIGSVYGNVSGSVAALVTNPISSVIARTAPLASVIQGTADLRVVQGASVAFLAAPGATIRNYVEHIQVANFGSSSVLVTFADNTTSILGYTIAPAGGGSNFDCFFKAAVNSPVTASINGTASVLVSGQGFTA